MATILRAESVRVEFGSTTAVQNVSFELDGGDLLGLIGPNGAGKTTLLRMLAGLQPPTRGRAFIMDKPVSGAHEVVRQHIGFAPDSPPAYDELTIDQFLQFIGAAYNLEAQETEERIDFWLEQLWLTEKRSVKIKTLSRGMRQRVTLARTFLPRPHVLLLDEPLAGLDPAGRIQLRRVLSMLREQGCAMIISSHILADLEEVATHIAILERGNILKWIRTDELHHEQESRRMYRMVTLDDQGDYRSQVEAMDGVTQVGAHGKTYTFDFHADESEAASLLRKLVDQNIPIVSFATVKKSLEETYLRAGVRQVD